MRWTSALTYLSIAALVAALASQLFGWTDGRGWFLLAWAVLLLPVAIGLLGHPMRAPTWGLFIGFWGVLAVVFLIVLQALAIANVLGDQWTAWPLAVAGIWIVVASGFGFGAEPFPAVVDTLGMLAGAGLVAIGVATWVGDSELLRNAGVTAAVAYCLWAAGLGWVFWGMQRATHRFRGVAIERRL
jgi:hypothetical protein